MTVRTQDTRHPHLVTRFYLFSASEKGWLRCKHGRHSEVAFFSLFFFCSFWHASSACLDMPCHYFWCCMYFNFQRLFFLSMIDHMMMAHGQMMCNFSTFFPSPAGPWPSPMNQTWIQIHRGKVAGLLSAKLLTKYHNLITTYNCAIVYSVYCNQWSNRLVK